MGEPVLVAEAIPILSEEKYKIKLKRKILDKEFEMTCVSMGNPHAVILVDNVEKFPIKVYGPMIEKEGVFPEKINVEFVQIIDKEHIKMRVWERGSGETLACGTGDCASTVACILNELIEPKITVQLTGGNLEVEWNRKNNHVYMTGPAVTVFKGEWIND